MEISKQKLKMLMSAYLQLAPYFGHEEYLLHLKNSGIKISDIELRTIFYELSNFIVTIKADTNPYLEIWDNESDPNEW